jgi:hypothetical protein
LLKEVSEAEHGLTVPGLGGFSSCRSTDLRFLKLIGVKADDHQVLGARRISCQAPYGWRNGLADTCEVVITGPGLRSQHCRLQERWCGSASGWPTLDRFGSADQQMSTAVAGVVLNEGAQDIDRKPLPYAGPMPVRCGLDDGIPNRVLVAPILSCHSISGPGEIAGQPELACPDSSHPVGRTR